MLEHLSLSTYCVPEPALVFQITLGPLVMAVPAYKHAAQVAARSVNLLGANASWCYQRLAWWGNWGKTCVCVVVCLRACLVVCLLVCSFVWLCVCLFVCLFVHGCVFVCVSMNVRLCVHSVVCLFACLCVCVFVCVCVCSAWWLAY